MRTRPNTPIRSPEALALCCVLLLTACSTRSTLPSSGPTAEIVEKAQVPRVSCKKQATERISRAPRNEEWVNTDGQLSELAASWIARVLGLLDKERELRRQEHACLDGHEKKGVIIQ